MRVKALLLLTFATLPLVACSATGADTPGASTDPTSTAVGGVPAAGRDGCLTGTWNVDVNDLGQQTAAKVGRGATGGGTGTITLSFGSEMKIKYNNVISIDSPISSGLTMNMKSTFAGEAASTDWTAKDGKIAGTMPTNSVTNTITMTVGGQSVPSTSIPMGQGGALDMSAGALGYTCSGNNATLISPAATWKLSKA